MKLSNHAIDRPKVVVMAMILVLLAAVFAATQIPIQRTPAIHTAVILIAVPHPGAQPTEVEEQITRKIEEKLQGLDNVDFIASTSMRGSSVTQVIFLDDVDADAARTRVKDLVDEVRRELPNARDVEPIVTDIDFENTPLMLVNITAPTGFDERSLKRTAEEIQDELESIPGVASTQLFGGRQREIQVEIDVDRAVEHDLTISDFRRALANYHAELPGGVLDTGEFDFQIRSESRFRTVDDIRAAVVTQEKGRVLRVGDVAQVRDGYRRLQNVAHLDGSDAATIIVYKESDINTLRTAQAVKQRVGDLQLQFPQFKFSVTRDSSAEIAIMFRVLGSSFIFGAMLVLIILSWTMGLRISILVLLAVPLSSAVGLIFLQFLDIPISNMVIFSFILVLGMVVDGAIIVAENIHRHIERGEDPVTASKVGIAEVGMPVIMADLTTIAAYLPMLLVPGIMGDFMGVMPVVVSVSLLGSVLVDHFVIPALSARWYKRRQVPGLSNRVVSNGVVSNGVVSNGAASSTDTSTGIRSEGAPPMRIRPRIGLIGRTYAVILNWALNHRWAVAACAVLAVVWAGFNLMAIGFEFFPPSDRGQFEVKFELPLGNSIQQTIAASKVITEPLEEMQRSGRNEVVHFVSALGSSEGLASRLETDPAVGPEFGSVMVELKSPLDRKRHEKQIIAELRRKIENRIDQFPGMKYSIREVEEGPPGGFDVAVRLSGDNHRQLGELAERIAGRLHQLPGAVDAGADYRAENPEIVIDPNPQVLPFFDISQLQVAQAIQTVVHGDTTIDISIGDEEVVVRLMARPEFRDTMQALDRIMLTGDSGRKATIGEVASLRRVMGLHAINRYEGKRAVVAKCEVNDPTTPDDIFTRLRAEILPQLGFRSVEGNKTAFLGKPGTPAEGVRATFTGENEERDENFVYLQWCMLIAVALIFAILVFQFNSFLQPCVVLVTVPLSFIGVIAGMWISGFPFSLATFIGLVSLAGIVVNDAIVVVDFINQARARGLPLRQAIVEAGVNRLRPVILTTVTTIGGLLPLFLNWSGGAEFWQPLTGAIIFGLGMATVLTLLVIPVGYSFVYNREMSRGS